MFSVVVLVVFVKDERVESYERIDVMFFLLCTMHTCVLCMLVFSKEWKYREA